MRHVDNIMEVSIKVINMKLNIDEINTANNFED